MDAILIISFRKIFLKKGEGDLFLPKSRLKQMSVYSSPQG